MQDKIQKQILDAFFVVLRPIAKILLRYGIGYREFAEVAKSAFVDVATSDFGIRGRPTNISRVAVMTGLTRKEVRRVRDQLESDDKSLNVKTTPLATVLHHWTTENEFLDKDGRPAKLPFSGDGRTFSSLVRKYGGDIPAGAMRTELKRVGALQEEENGTLRVLKRNIVPNAKHEYLVMSLMHSAYSLLSTIAFNTDGEKSESNWAQYLTYSLNIRADKLKSVRRISLDRITEIATSFDDLFSAYEQDTEDDGTKKNSQTVAVGLYYFEERDSKVQSIWDINQ